MKTRVLDSSTQIRNSQSSTDQSKPGNDLQKSQDPNRVSQHCLHKAHMGPHFQGGKLRDRCCRTHRCVRGKRRGWNPTETGAAAPPLRCRALAAIRRRSNRKRRPAVAAVGVVVFPPPEAETETEERGRVSLLSSHRLRCPKAGWIRPNSPFRRRRRPWERNVGRERESEG